MVTAQLSAQRLGQGIVVAPPVSEAEQSAEQCGVRPVDLPRLDPEIRSQAKIDVEIKQLRSWQL